TDLLCVVTTEKGRDVLCGGKAPQQCPHIPLGWEIQSSRRLIEEQHFGMSHERARNFNTSFHTSAVCADQPSAKTDLETDIVQHPLDFIDGVRNAPNTGEIRQVLSRRPGRLTLARLVADEADQMSDGERIRHDVVSPQRRATLGWRK